MCVKLERIVRLSIGNNERGVEFLALHPGNHLPSFYPLQSPHKGLLSHPHLLPHLERSRLMPPWDRYRN